MDSKISKLWKSSRIIEDKKKKNGIIRTIKDFEEIWSHEPYFLE